ncbi:MAG: 60S ribosomal protein L22 [Promethearchaeota archaeon]
MSSDTKKMIKVDLKDLLFKGEQHVEDLVRFLNEALPLVEITRNGNVLELNVHSTLSKRAVKLRLKKFFHKNKLKDDLRAISFPEGYIIKEKKRPELTYY